MKKSLLLIAPIILLTLAVFCSCSAQKTIEIRRMEYYDCLYHIDYISLTNYEVFFLVKNASDELPALYDEFDSYARQFLSAERLAYYESEINKRYDGKSKRQIHLRFFRTSRYLPWKMSEDFDYPEIQEGWPVDFIGSFIFDLDKKEFRNEVFKRKKGFSDYGKIIERFSKNRGKNE